MMYSGYIIGVISIPIIWIKYQSLGVLNGIMYSLLIPTIISAITGPARWIRDITRLLLGVTMISFYAILITSILNFRLWITALTLVVYFSLKIPLTRKRENSNNKICQTCPEISNPRCSGMKDFHDRQMIVDGSSSRIDIFAE